MDEKQLQKYWQAYTDAWRLIKNRDRVRETHVAEMVKKHDIGVMYRLFCLVVWQEIKRINNGGIPLEDSKYQEAFTSVWKIFKKYCNPDDSDVFWYGLVREINDVGKLFKGTQFIRNMLVNVTLEEIERIWRIDHEQKRSQ
ncbi:hypothetical protein [Enterocloster lavalensis]|uniref:hypothetical protein n=1 Tax=Enterocloster lavalensis TaxID=460384 RepID=UPI001D060C15|nr:hypothetical protein [Enterocloster lavalensis]MCB6343690.1 hypothetical protein [Enterocloster lavalensis]